MKTSYFFLAGLLPPPPFNGKAIKKETFFEASLSFSTTKKKLFLCIFPIREARKKM